LFVGSWIICQFLNSGYCNTLNLLRAFISLNK
jgi:hypothetical protein